MEAGVCSAHMDPQEGGDYKQTLQGKCVVTASNPPGHVCGDYPAGHGDEPITGVRVARDHSHHLAPA
jgi:hypothetical protein